MHYDFIEIGTGNWYTEAEQNPNLVGISVEPIKHYLDCLPNRPNIKKINVAISPRDVEELVTMFYIPESTIDKLGLPFWLKGCNSVDQYHHWHLELNLHHLVKKLVVPSIPISKLLIDNEVSSLSFLKIDAEGSDADIMLHFWNFLKDKSLLSYPKRILFETNQKSLEEKYQTVVDKFTILGYNLVYRDNENTGLEYSGVEKRQLTRLIT